MNSSQQKSQASRLCYVKKPPLWSQTAERMLKDRVPGQLLQQAIEALFLISEFGLFQNRRHWKADRAAAIDHGVIAVAD